jgi:hypothetical protein
MMFGRVEAIATVSDPGWLHLLVQFESGRTVRTVRDEIVPQLFPVTNDADVAWQADQYVQETIANELALEGWEVIGGGPIPAVEDSALPRSASYAVRRLGAVDQ